MRLLFILLITTSFNIFAKDCKSLVECLKLTHDLTQINFILPENFKDQKVSTVGSVDWSKEKSIFNLSQLLWLNDYVVADFDFQKTVKIINARDIRYQPLRLIDADKTKPELNAIVSAIGYISILYKFENEGHDLREVTSSIRPTLSRYGRVVEYDNYNQILINDYSLNAAEVLKLLRNFDVKLNSDQLKKIKQNQDEHKKIRMIKAQNPEHHEQASHKHN
jgi:type II secretory pathway component GspD/PulD (secretin)